jgi:hypothetical protein
MVATVVLAALSLQVIIALNAPGAPPAHAVGTLAGAPLAGRLLRVASFFTIQSNVLVMLTCAQLAREPTRDGRVWRVLRLDALVGIAVTGIVYATVLARIHEPKGWEQIISNAVFHYGAPIAAVVGWLVLGPRPRIDRRVLLHSLIWPMLWFVYTLARGALSHWYPYPFVDATTHGYPRVIANAVLVVLVLGLVAGIYLLGDTHLPARPSRAQPDASSLSGARTTRMQPARSDQHLVDRGGRSDFENG